MTDPLALLRFEVDDVVQDAVLEYGAITGVGPDEARETVDAVLAWYHHGTAPEPPAPERTHKRLIAELAQPFRLPDMTVRMGRLIDGLRQDPALRTALDYGGGSGKDSIILGRAGYDVTYSDLLGEYTPLVAKRFELRGLDVRRIDVRDPEDRRYDIVNCMDVVEHVYDLEFVAADLVARLRTGGRLLCFPAFYNTWDGDHVEKNCAYRTFFEDMLEAVGMEIVDRFDAERRIGGTTTSVGPTTTRQALGLKQRRPAVLHLIRRRPESGTVEEEREEVRRELYRVSRRRSAKLARSSLGFLPIVAAMAVLHPVPRHRARLRNKRDGLFDNAIDGLAVWRLSRHQMS
ncbi:MAG: methyltransferase domain-containing protein [Planctomycetota bacterium]